MTYKIISAKNNQSLKTLQQHIFEPKQIMTAAHYEMLSIYWLEIVNLQSKWL